MKSAAKTPPCFTIALVSGLALAYEVLLLRLFSIIQWHHFAYMIISMAMLGYGMSGAFVTVLHGRLLDRFRTAFIVNILLFGFSSIVCFLIAQRIPFNPEEILWDPMHLLMLLVIYLLLSLPFFFAANLVALVFIRYRQDISRVYAFNLIGAGIGSIGIVYLLFFVLPISALKILGGLGITAVAFAWWELRTMPRLWELAAILAAGMVFILPTDWTRTVISPYKGLSQQLRISKSRITEELSSPLALLTVVENQEIPLRHAPGLSLNATVEPPAQLGVFIDADAMTAINLTDDQQRLSFLDQLTWALPYHLKRPEKVLVLGAGAGNEVLQARYHGVGKIDAVEINPQLIGLVRRHTLNSIDIYRSEDVSVHIADARGFVSDSNEKYDLIQVALLDSSSASGVGLYAVSENYLYTREAFEGYLGRLQPDGYLAISRWITLPPRDTLKITATAVEALKRLGVKEPGNRLLLIRGWQTSTLLIKNGPISSGETEKLKEFCQERSFDPVYYPGMPAAEANQYNQLREPYFYNAVRELLGSSPERFLDDYKFNISPATDNRPYFHQFFKWKALPEILSLRGKGGMPLLQLGYLILLATLVQALVASLVLIIVPILIYRHRQRGEKKSQQQWRVLVYFSAIGLAFLFVEIAFIQKFILLLKHPLYAAALVLTVFLIFAGYGSLLTNRLQKKKGRITKLWPLAAIIVVGAVFLLTSPLIIKAMLAQPAWARALIAVLLTAPLAFLMGMPFPLALAEISAEQPQLIPWAWGVNGCASVISAVLATIIAIHFGFTVVVALALALYGIAALSFPGRSSA